MTLHTPTATSDLASLIQEAAAARTPLEVIGGGSKREIGFPDRQTTRLSMSRFDRVIDYDPAELVLTVGAGVRLKAIDELLEAHAQMLAFEPFDFARVSGTAPGDSTIGGLVATGIAGSRRLSAGNVRDHVLGFRGVSGRGESFVAGGRVVKNVTGYDLAKLMCGSWGQLAAMTEITLKVLPRPRVSLTLCWSGLEETKAFEVMTLAVRSQCSVAAAAYLPNWNDARSCTLLRLEGFEPSVEARAAQLVDVLRNDVRALPERLPQTISAQLWPLLPDAPSANDVTWRVNVPSTAGVRMCTSLRALDARYRVDWAGALIWATLPATVRAARVRELAEQCGGHATLIRAPLDYRREVPALHPEPAGVASLSDRVRDAFDPAGIFDPARFVTR